MMTSTHQAETYAATLWFKEEEYVRNVLKELSITFPPRSRCLCDQSGVIVQATNPSNSGSAKHYRLSQAYIRQRCESGEVLIEKVESAENPADMLTKPLVPNTFIKHRAQLMGPQECPCCKSKSEESTHEGEV